MTKFNAFAGVDTVFDRILDDSRLTALLPGLNREEKTVILIDGNNILGMTDILGFEIDYAKLRKVFEARCRLDTIEMFVGINATNPDHVAWTDFLREKYKYRMKAKPIKWKGNVDIEMAIRAMRLHESVEHVILATGDSDFIPLVEELINDGRRVSILGSRECVPNAMSQDLINAADLFYELNQIKPYIARTETDADGQNDCPRSPSFTFPVRKENV